MAQFEYTRWDGTQPFTPQSADQLFDQFSQYLMDYGDEILGELDRLEEEHPDVVDMLIQRGYVEKDHDGQFMVTPKGLRRVQNKALEELFDVRTKGNMGRHETEFRGPGQTVHEESKPYQYGDPVSNLNMHETLKNAWIRSHESHDQAHGQRSVGTEHPAARIDITEDDLVVHDTEYQTTCATVVLLDMSGSMMRYGKFAAAKRVALALQALVRSRYQGDFLQFVGFYTYATPLTEKQLLYSAPKPCEPVRPIRPAADQPRSPPAHRAGALHEHPCRPAVRPPHPAQASSLEQADHRHYRRRADRPCRGPRAGAHLSPGREDVPADTQLRSSAVPTKGCTSRASP